MTTKTRPKPHKAPPSQEVADLRDRLTAVLLAEGVDVRHTDRYVEVLRAHGLNAGDISSDVYQSSVTDAEEYLKTHITWREPVLVEFEGLEDVWFWSSTCGRYRIARNNGAYPGFDAYAKVQAVCSKEETICNERRTLQSVLDTVERYHCDRYGVPSVVTNAAAIMEGARRERLDAAPRSRYDKGDKPRPVVVAVTADGEKPSLAPPEPMLQGGGAKGARYELFGHPVTAVLRWMGKQGWDFAGARAALNNLGAACADATVRAQLLAGRQGTRGDPAPLTPANVKELERAKG